MNDLEQGIDMQMYMGVYTSVTFDNTPWSTEVMC